jgi:hypothetical protein
MYGCLFDNKIIIIGNIERINKYVFYILGDLW